MLELYCFKTFGFAKVLNYLLTTFDNLRIHPVCWQVWPVQTGPLRKLVSVVLEAQTWSSQTAPNDIWVMPWSGLTNQVSIRQTILSSVWHGPHQMKKKNGLLCLARFIDRPHQEKPGSPKQCLHSCQAATHTQTLAYITVRYWRSADTNTPKQKNLRLMQHLLF